MITVYFIVMTAMNIVNGGLAVQNVILQDTNGRAIYTHSLEDFRTAAMRHASGTKGNPRRLLGSRHIVMNCVAMDIPKRGKAA